jgi:hypothetical protein
MEVALGSGWIVIFKMNEMSNRPEIAGWFYRVIEEHDVKAAISCVIHTNELIKVNNNIKYPSYVTNTELLDNPYYFGFKAIIDVLAQKQTKLGLHQPVQFVFDDDGEKKRALSAWELIKQNSALQFAALMGDTPIYRDDKNTLPLQAADLYAWWILKWEREGLIEAIRDLPFPWGAQKVIPRLAMRFRERDFLIETSRALARNARNVPEFAYAMSILPPGEHLVRRND